MCVRPRNGTKARVEGKSESQRLFLPEWRRLDHHTFSSCIATTKAGKRMILPVRRSRRGLAFVPVQNSPHPARSSAQTHLASSHHAHHALSRPFSALPSDRPGRCHQRAAVLPHRVWRRNRTPWTRCSEAPGWDCWATCTTSRCKPDGKLLVAGGFHGLARLMPDGNTDGSFPHGHRRYPHETHHRHRRAKRRQDHRVR